ncbi:MAG: hypothetical protein ABTQ25_01310 [Nitrosomonas ureae]
MQPIRKIYQDAPSVVSIDIPAELQHQPVEVIIRPLVEEVASSTQTDENGWPLDFFDQTFGSIPDLPDREWQGDYEEREPLA